MSTDKLVDFDEVLSRYEPVIGLETHVELGTASKMFCGCSTTFGADPNTQTCPVCLGLPGSLPVANEAAIEATIRIGLALGCRIATWCRFARKNYFYPDIPKGFQTTQYDEPLCTAGHLDVEVDGETYRVEIERVHLEEDTGKNLHVGGATGRIHGADHSLIDYNRAGIPLVEIVTRPIPGAGAKAPEVAKAYVTELREILLALGVSEVRMEQGNLRCDVNTSLAPIGSLEWGTRTETKNVNSLRSVERAVRFEMRRQAAVLDAGERVHQETRHFHEDTGSTSPGRSKEEATDYRYFPEPDLVPVAPDEEWVAKLGATLPELPAARRARLSDEWGIAPTEMAWLVNAGARRAGQRHRRGRGPARRGPQVVAGRARPPGQRRGCRAGRARRHPGPGRRAGRAGGRRHDQRPARPAGPGRRARRRGRSGGGRRGPRAGRHGRLRRAGRRRRRGDRGQPRRRRQGPRRQGAGHRCPGRRGHEDHPRQGRRGHRQADARGTAPRLSAVELPPVELGARRADFPLLARWLAEPLVARWWAHDTSADAVERDFGPAVDGAEPTAMYLGCVDGEPFGLVQVYAIAAYPEYVDELAPVCEVPPGALSIDYLVGEPSARGRGLGAAMIAAGVARGFADHPRRTMCSCRSRGQCRLGARTARAGGRDLVRRRRADAGQPDRPAGPRRAPVRPLER